MNGEKSELELLIRDIKRSTSQIAVNKVDEIKVMKCMLNDPNFTLDVYDKNIGYIGRKNPHDEAVTFVKNIIMGATGLDGKDSKHLADNYQFTTRDANFMLDNMRNFVQVYMTTGRKMNVMQTAATEACIFTKTVKSSNKRVPDKENPGRSKQITTSPYIKLVSASKCPRYTDD